jgi:hypothetical protein
LEVGAGGLPGHGIKAASQDPVRPKVNSSAMIYPESSSAFEKALKAVFPHRPGFPVIVYCLLLGTYEKVGGA